MPGECLIRTQTTRKGREEIGNAGNRQLRGEKVKKEENRAKRTASRLMAAIFFVSLFPAVFSSVMQQAVGSLRFPIARAETATAIFPRLASVRVYLENYLSFDKAADFALLYANTFLYNIIALAVVLLLIGNPLYASAKRSAASNVSIRDSGGGHVEPITSRTVLLAALSLLALIIWIFLVPTSPHGSPTMSPSRGVDSQYAVIESGFALFNIVMMINMFVIIAWTKSRFH